jgi:hypothetical protein
MALEPDFHKSLYEINATGDHNNTFLQLVVSAWWTCRHMKWEVSIMSFDQENPSSGGKPTQTPLLGYKEDRYRQFFSHSGKRYILFVQRKICITEFSSSITHKNMSHKLVFSLVSTLETYAGEKCNTQVLTK